MMTRRVISYKFPRWMDAFKRWKPRLKIEIERLELTYQHYCRQMVLNSYASSPHTRLNTPAVAALKRAVNVCASVLTMATVLIMNMCIINWEQCRTFGRSCVFFLFSFPFSNLHCRNMKVEFASFAQRDAMMAAAEVRNTHKCSYFMLDSEWIL